MTGNSFYGGIAGFSQSQYPSNTYYSSRPTGVKVFIRPNAYEAGRANVTVYNWANQSSVSVDLTGILAPGTGFEIRNAHDFFGAPVVTGTYSGGSVSIPMTGLSVAAPVGWGAPATTGPEFGAFVVLPASPGGTPTPTSTPTARRRDRYAATQDSPTTFPHDAHATPTPGGVIPAPWVQQDIGDRRAGPGDRQLRERRPSRSRPPAPTSRAPPTQLHYVYQPTQRRRNDRGPSQQRRPTPTPGPRATSMIRREHDRQLEAARCSSPDLPEQRRLSFQRRLSDRSGTPTQTPPGPTSTAPYWVQLVRSGQHLDGDYDSPGRTATPTFRSTPAPTLPSTNTPTATPSPVSPTATPRRPRRRFPRDDSDRHSDVDSPTGIRPRRRRTRRLRCRRRAPTPPATTFVLRLEAESAVLEGPMWVGTTSQAFGGRTFSRRRRTRDGHLDLHRTDLRRLLRVEPRVAVDPEHDSFYAKTDGPEDVFDDAENTWSPNWQWSVLNGRNGTGVPLTLDPRRLVHGRHQHVSVPRARAQQRPGPHPHHQRPELRSHGDAVIARDGISMAAATGDERSHVARCCGILQKRARRLSARLRRPCSNQLS